MYLSNKINDKSLVKYWVLVGNYKASHIFVEIMVLYYKIQNSKSNVTLKKKIHE